MKKSVISSIVALGLVVAMVMPAFAGTWRQEGSDWKYYSENGETVGSAWIDNCYVNSSGKWVKSR